ncbi:MAG: patatin-like phospholipase family protein [Solirubrobacteraceae bacterium]
MPRQRTSAHASKRGVVGVVLAGGGARGAYELGALSVLLPVLEQRGESPRIFVGTSVGAINAASLAATSHLPAQEAIVGELARWHEVDRGAVISPILPRLPLTAIRFAGELLSLPGVRVASLLDPSPLERNLRRWIDWPQLHRNLAGTSTCRLAVIATAARTGRAVAFVEGDTHEAITTSHVIDYVPASLDETHVRASAAIPILFPPVRVEDPPEARGWYIDGATRLNTPIKPALDLGAERLVVIGTGSVIPAPKNPGRHDAPAPDLGSSALHLLQGALADPLVEDLRKLADINTFYTDKGSSPAAARHRQAHGKPPYRQIPYMFIAPRTPSAIAKLATDVFHSRYGGLKALRSPDLAVLSRLLGGQSHTHGELLSYLLFDHEFISALIEMGAQDATAWLNMSPGIDEPWQVDPLDALNDSGRPAKAND